MKRLFLTIPMVVGLLTAWPAQACLADPVPKAIVFANLPDERPQGSFVVKVELVRHEPASYFSMVRVVEGPSKMVGRKYRISPNDLGSCTTFGRDKGYAVLDGEVHYSEGQGYLLAITYNRSWTDHLLGFFIVEPYRWAGSPSEPLIIKGVE